MLSDDTLTALYEGNGLFAKIIDTPAEEATRQLPVLRGDKDAAEIVREGLDCLAWEEQALTAVRWARLFGGSIAVMLVDDGGRLEDPLRMERVRSVDDLRVYPRSQVSVDLTQAQPEYFHVSSRYGDFTVHESRCLLFRNDPMPELTESPLFQFWGVPEAYRISAAVDRAALASEQAVRMLDASIQAVYRLKGASAILATDEGEQRVVQRLQVIDAARNAWNIILLDADSEDYSFIAAGFDGKGEVAELALRYLAAVSCIPPEILYGYICHRLLAMPASVINEYIYAPVLLYYILYKALCGAGIGNVVHLIARIMAYLIACALQNLLPAPGHHHLRPGGSQAAGYGIAQTAAAPRNEGHSPIKAECLFKISVHLTCSFYSLYLFPI